MSLADEYRDYFIRNLHDALSGHTSSTVDEAVRYDVKKTIPVSPVVLQEWEILIYYNNKSIVLF